MEASRSALLSGEKAKNTEELKMSFAKPGIWRDARLIEKTKRRRDCFFLAVEGQSFSATGASCILGLARANCILSLAGTNRIHSRKSELYSQVNCTFSHRNEPYSQPRRNEPYSHLFSQPPEEISAVSQRACAWRVIFLSMEGWIFLEYGKSDFSRIWKVGFSSSMEGRTLFFFLIVGLAWF